MKIKERLVQKVDPDKWPQLAELNAQWAPVNQQYGFPTSRFYRVLTGPEDLSTQIVEREWESMAACEAAWEKLMAGPEYAALSARLTGVVLSNRWEFYMVL
jgi:hypothetical protein